MTDRNSKARRPWVAVVVAAVLVTGVLSGCTVNGTASAPEAEVAAYKSQQLIKRQKANAMSTCMTVSVTLAGSSAAYNRYIAALNAQNPDPKLATDVVNRFNSDVEYLRKASTEELPDDLKEQLKVLADTRETQSRTVASKNIQGLNAAADRMNQGRAKLNDVCRGYLP
ncbi:hypothetical protein GOARA_026_00270 [Gordonia araii NBRC 100433]|uniref:Lipoprotein n=1 Tax=Gordonia araii NBRC 100433 TaxID=1073574 RepID=G7GZH2_9ACTN|nr:hypothetical protein [Gordonia araii]NNG97933.1 hypothetical protein [Gordonia araii NBRC 100433]GAB08997.1 hypothetical protein GOARA_026_00270 [Gordonia araii NBRC 100433]